MKSNERNTPVHKYVSKYMYCKNIQDNKYWLLCNSAKKETYSNGPANANGPVKSMYIFYGLTKPKAL